MLAGKGFAGTAYAMKMLAAQAHYSQYIVTLTKCWEACPGIEVWQAGPGNAMVKKNW